jgi:hypothetical protein
MRYESRLIKYRSTERQNNQDASNRLYMFCGKKNPELITTHIFKMMIRMTSII